MDQLQQHNISSCELCQKKDIEFSPEFILFCTSCRNGDLDTLKSLTHRCKSLINTYDIIGDTIPIHYAVKNNHLDIVRFLLENGANAESCDGETYTPFLL